MHNKNNILYSEYIKQTAIFSWFLFVTFIFCINISVAEISINVSKIRIGIHGNHTRLVIETSKPIAYSAFILSNPDRLVIDLPAVNWRAGRIKDGGLITGLRFGLFKAGISRIVIDAKQSIKIIKHFRLAPSGSNAHRLVFDISADFSNLNYKKIISYDWQKYISQKKLPTIIKKISIKNSTKSQKITIVIDPGHGGPDPGAIGIGGSYEKKITLAVAKVVKKKLEKTGRYNVILTRNQDIYIPLRKRYGKAEKHQAQLFISLHADKIGRSNVRGASVYTLSEKASDKEAAALARKENKADIIVGEDLSIYDENVAHILLDIQQRSTMQESAYFAEMMVSELGSKITLLRNTHRFAGFAVLKSPTIPSVLVELGYLSNRKDEKLLSNSKHHLKIAAAILKACDRFFKRKKHLNGM